MYFGFILLFRLYINGRIHIVHILLVQFIPEKLNRFTETLEMDNFPFPEEFDDIVHIRVVTDSQNVVIGGSGFLFWERIA